MMDNEGLYTNDDIKKMIVGLGKLIKRKRGPNVALIKVR